MKKLWVTFFFCISILTVQTSFAAENESSDSDHKSFSEDKKSRDKGRYASDDRRSEHRHRHGNSKREWQAGTTLPEQYRHNDNQIDYSQNSRLSPPTKYQQWRKVNNQYVLMNVITNTIIKVVPE